MTVDEEIIRKIQKMLELADPSKNDNANQMEVAMRKAQEFMRAHGLSMADVAVKDNDGDLEITVGIWQDEEKSQYDTWVQVLAQAAAHLLGVKCIMYRSGAENRYRCKMGFVGEETDIQITANVWPWLVKHGRKAARKAMDSGEISEHRSFVEAFANRVFSRALEMAEAAEDEETDDRYLMVMSAKRQALHAYLEKMNLRKARNVSVRGSYDAQSAMAGAEEGEKVNLDFRRQLGGGGETKLIT